MLVLGIVWNCEPLKIGVKALDSGVICLMLNMVWCAPNPEGTKDAGNLFCECTDVLVRGDGKRLRAECRAIAGCEHECARAHYDGDSVAE